MDHECINTNKLIAEFMSGEHPLAEVTHEAHHNYDTSWDWLMPVIEQIDHLQHEPIQGIEDALATRCIGDTYNAVVEFIKEHNRTTDYNKVTYYDGQ
jgi:hypothetical protein